MQLIEVRVQFLNMDFSIIYVKIQMPPWKSELNDKVYCFVDWIIFTYKA